MSPDLQCTWSPEWFFFEITDACIEHDLGLGDEGFFWAIVALGTAAGFKYRQYIPAVIYYLGVKIGGPVYRAFQRSKK